MKTTQYFEHLRNRPDRVMIQDQWILGIIANPAKTEVQSDGRIRHWGYIAEVNKHLRVIVFEDGETVHNAFFDRNYKG